MHLEVALYSHHFSATKLTPRGREACLAFAKRMIHYTLTSRQGRTFSEATKVFAASNRRRTYFRFHINQYAEFKQHLLSHHINEDLFRVIQVPMYAAPDVIWTVKPGFTAHDYQEPAIEYFVGKEPISKLLTFATGKGKTLTTQLAIALKGKRILLIIKSMYVDKWIADMLGVFEMTKEDIAVIRGSKSLLVLLNEAKEGLLKEKCIIMSNSTYQAWLTLYEQYDEDLKELGYPCAPHEMCQLLGVGEKIIDEVHQHFHLCFKSDLYTHCPSSISLSATLLNKDTMLQKMYEVMFPQVTRYKQLELDRYIDVTAVLYMFNKVERIKTTAYGSTMFSSGAVEQSIMRHIPTLKNWFGLIDRIIEIGFLQVKREKKKLLIYAYSVDMINLIVADLKIRYPQFDIRRYTQEDPYENLFKADICVTTVGSAGTAVDIPNLTNLILTNNLASEQANIQLIGRLRQLPDKHPVQVHYLVAANIEKSMAYHHQKIELFKNRVKSHTSYSCGYNV